MFEIDDYSEDYNDDYEDNYRSDICGCCIAERQMERQADEFPVREKWGPIIQKDLKGYPLLPDDIREFILDYCISAITDALIEDHKERFKNDKQRN